MSKITLTIRNFKLIKELRAEFKSGNLTMIRASNNRGKTTVTQALRAVLTSTLPKDAVTHGEERGMIDALITNKDGQAHRVTIDLKDDKAPVFTIIKPDLSQTKRKTDLAGIFNYTQVNPEEFMALGGSEAGRRKQAEMLMSLMPIKTKQQINTLDSSITTDYDRRREVGVLVKNTPTAEEPTAEEKEFARNADDWAEMYDKQKSSYDESVMKFHANKSEKEAVGRAIEATKNRITAIKQQLEREEKEFAGYLDDFDDLDAQDITDPALIKEDLNKNLQAVNMAKDAKAKVETYDLNHNKSESLNNDYNSLTEAIDNNRRLKKDLVEENIPISGIAIEDGQLQYVENDEMFPFNEESLSYSRGVITVAKMMLELNPDVPLVTIGKSAELSKESMKEIQKLAEEKDAIVVLDSVSQEESELEIKVVELTEN